MLNSDNTKERQSLNETRDNEVQNTNAVKKTCLRVLNDPYYFMLLHVSNLIVLNAFLVVEFWKQEYIKSEEKLLKDYML